jgi:peptide/nickel transport system substrate-binding protein
LALPASAPFPRAALEAEGGAERLPVTGPYYVETWEPARLIGLERNEWWEPSSDPVRRADPGRVRWRLDLTIEEAVERTRDGRLDLLVGASPRGRLLAGLVTDPRTSARLIAEPAGCLRFIFLNTEEPPFDRLVVREAVATALDRYMLNRLFGGPAAGDIATSIVPPGVPGHVPAAAFDPFPTTEWTGDLPTARRMLRRAGAEVLDEPIVLLGSESSPGREILGSVRGDLERLGFTNMKVETASGAELVEAFRSGDAHVGTEGSWCKDYEDAGTILRPLFHSSELASGSNFNLARLRDASLDGAIERAEGLPPGEERTAAWAGVNRDATELAAIIPWTWDRTTILHGPRLRNVRYLAPLTQVDWTNVRIRRTR